MDHLVTLLITAEARELRFCTNEPPVLIFENVERVLEGPPLAGEEVEQLLRSIANSRQMRELQQRRNVQFVFTVRDRMPVLVRARMEDDIVAFDIS